MGWWSALLCEEGKSVAIKVERVEGIWENECHVAKWYGQTLSVGLDLIVSQSVRKADNAIRSELEVFSLLKRLCK